MKMLTQLTIGLLAGLTLPAHASGAVAGQETFEYGVYGHMLVPVSIAGGPPRTFAFDTGASHVVLDQATYASQFPSAASQSGGSGAHGAHGTIATTPVQLDSVRLWDSEQENLQGIVLPIEALGHKGTPDFVGVLGIPYLSRFELDIDFARQTLTMNEHADGAVCEVCQQEGAIELGVLPGGLISLNLTVNGRPLLAVLDSGAAKSVLNAAAAELLTDSNPVSGDTIMANVGIGGDFVSQPTEVALLELPVFRVLGLEQQPAMILGLDVLASAHLRLDIEGRKAWFQDSGAVSDV